MIVSDWQEVDTDPRVYTLRSKLKRTTRIVLFCGEEQGLYGSTALSREWKEQGVQIHAMLNADMLGWQASQA